jgi:hypothetical protein
MRNKREVPLTCDELRARELTQYPYAKKSHPKPRVQPKRSEAIAMVQVDLLARILDQLETKDDDGTDQRRN